MAQTGDGVCIGEPRVDGEGDASGVGAAVLGSAEGAVDSVSEALPGSLSASSFHPKAQTFEEWRLWWLNADPSRAVMEIFLFIAGNMRMDRA